MTSDESVRTAAETASDAGGLDVLINNAGIGGPRKDPADTSPSDFLGCFGVNLLGPVRVTSAFLPLLAASDSPRIVMVSSGMGSFGVTTHPERFEHQIVGLVYPSFKAALNMVTTMYAKALPQIGSTPSTPGYTATDLNGHRSLQTVEQGAEVVVRLAGVAPDGPTSGFFSAEGAVPW